MPKQRIYIYFQDKQTKQITNTDRNKTIYFIFFKKASQDIWMRPGSSWLPVRLSFFHSRPRLRVSLSTPRSSLRPCLTLSSFIFHSFHVCVSPYCIFPVSLSVFAHPDLIPVLMLMLNPRLTFISLTFSPHSFLSYPQFPI